MTDVAAAALLGRLLDGARLPGEELIALLRASTAGLAALPTVVELEPLAPGETVTVVGDLHCQLTCGAWLSSNSEGICSENCECTITSAAWDPGSPIQEHDVD